MDFRSLPAVHRLVDELVEQGRVSDIPRSLVVDAARRVIDEHRAALVKGDTPTTSPADGVVAKLAADRRPRLEPVINATGIIIHTGLGRSPWPREAVEAAAAVAGGYAPVELDLPTGRRGQRADVVRALLCELTGAESATVVNNNAAAMVLVLSAIAGDTKKGVVVSRGELVEIGGSFRLPDVMKSSGARLQEVGTTNRTRLSDYERAIDDTTAALMKVHTSNFRVEGFTATVTVDELATLGHAHGIPVIDDIGSGALRPCTEGPLAGEPSARESIEAGADLVLFSGDKLLGGPQAGIIVGRRTLVDRVAAHPMMRAMRIDKVMLAGLAAVLQLHRDGEQAAQAIPVLSMLRTKVETLRERARRVVEHLKDLDRVVDTRVELTTAYVGGGSLPTEAIPSVAITIRPSPLAEISEEEIADRLRRFGAVPRVGDGAVWLDLRTVIAEQDAQLAEAVRTAVAG